VSMLSEYGKEKYNHYKDDFSLSPLELCLYCQKSITRGIDANSGPAGDATGTSVGGISVDREGFAPTCKEHYQNNNNSLRIFVAMCHGLKNNDGSDVVNLDKEPWASLKVSMYPPNLVEWRNEIRRRAMINIATKQPSKVSKKDNPSPNQWTITKCQQWLKTFPITNPSDVIFLCSEMQVRLKVTAAAVEQKRSEEQRLQNHDEGNNWYGNNPILRLIHTLDKTEIRHAYMERHDLSNECIVLDNMKSVEKREETVWQKMVNTWNNEKFSPITMVLSPKLSTQFVNSWVITFDSCSEYAAATPDKCANRFATMIVELHRLIGRWSLSGKGDEDLDEYDANDKNDNLMNLSCCSQGAIDSQANFLGTSQPYILHLWEYLNAHDLLKTSFQCLDPKVVAKNGGKGVPSIICSLPVKCSPSDTSTMELTNRENEDAISVSITLLGENNLRAARIESNAT
jgi:hypothetical protein